MFGRTRVCGRKKATEKDVSDRSLLTLIRKKAEQGKKATEFPPSLSE